MATVTAERAYALACEHYRHGRFAEAESLCRQILRAAPAHRDTLLLLAALAHRQGNTREGDELLVRAVGGAGYSITLDAPLDPKPRWSPHPKLEALLQSGLERFRGLLRSFEEYAPWLGKIAVEADPGDPESPHWNNPWLPALDAVALYCLVAQRRPRHYVEIGSGNSTKFVARAIADHGLDTRIVSIDPQPRAEIDALCDEVLRRPLEQCNLDVFGALGKNDIVFADNSHRAFMNSDVTVFFCEILPALASGVTVGIHDIFLPYDYPEEWIGRYYSEQYLLACHLLSGSPRFDIVLPAYFALKQPRLQDAVSALSARLPEAVRLEGVSFWVEMN